MKFDLRGHSRSHKVTLLEKFCYLFDFIILSSDNLDLRSYGQLLSLFFLSDEKKCYQYKI